VSDLHERLLAEIDRCQDGIGPDGGLGDALRAVVELHAPVKLPIGETLYCDGCGNLPSWPCSTIQAIARELGVDGA
jgi:hypothetical protein